MESLLITPENYYYAIYICEDLTNIAYVLFILQKLVSPSCIDSTLVVPGYVVCDILRYRTHGSFVLPNS